MKLKNILVPIDFSEYALNALTLAKQIAKKTRGTIYLLHIIEIPIDKYSFIKDRQKGIIKNIYTSHFIEVVKKKLYAIQQENESTSFTFIESLKIGDPYDEIVKFIEEDNIDMIIIGAKGIKDREEFYLGSLTEKIIRSIACPVITVKKFPISFDMKNIIYAIDFELDHSKITSVIKEFQAHFESSIYVVKINKSNEFQNDDQILNDLKSLAINNNFKNYNTNIYNHPNEEYGIIEFAEQKNADLIVVGVNEKSGVRRLISGGILYNEIKGHAFRPVLTFHFDIRK